jgi:hypothetical protein
MLITAAQTAAQSSASARNPPRPRPALTVELPPPDSLARLGPVVRATNVLTDGSVRELLDHGFPVRLRYRVELWSTAGWFDDQIGATQWELVARFDALHRMYDVVEVYGDSVAPLGSFGQLAAAVAELERPRRAPLAARASGQQYYNVVLTLELLSVSDLDELQRWLRGDLSRAVRGQRNPGTALGRGARTLFTRLLGGETRTLEVQSRKFRPAAPGSR